MIKVQQLKKHFGEIKALDDLSFCAKDGRITGILGPNGAGKTTCLRTIYGLLQADNGEVIIDGIKVADDPIAARSRLGIFPDKFGLYERLTAYEQIDYFASIHGLEGKKKKVAIARVIQDLNLEDIAGRKTQGFSQGQRMKVTLAQAMVHRPQNIVLDEPTRGLDVMSTRILRDHLRQFKDAGHCVLFSSHVMQEVAALCDWVVVVAKGKLAAQGTLQDLCELTGEAQLEDAFVKIIGTDEGVAA